MVAKDTLYAGAIKQDQREQALSPDLQASNNLFLIKTRQLSTAKDKGNSVPTPRMQDQ